MIAEREGEEKKTRNEFTFRNSAPCDTLRLDHVLKFSIVGAAWALGVTFSNNDTPSIIPAQHPQPTADEAPNFTRFCMDAINAVMSQLETVDSPTSCWLHDEVSKEQ